MNPRRVLVVVYPGIQSLDVSGPVEVFSTANRESGVPHYRIELAGTTTAPGVAKSGLKLGVDVAISDVRGAIDTLLVAGGEGVTMAAAHARLVAGVRRVVVLMEHTAGGKPKLLKRCNLPLTGAGVVDLIVTELGVFEVSAKGPDGGLRLVDIAPDVALEEIHHQTDGPFPVPNGCEVAGGRAPPRPGSEVNSLGIGVEVAVGSGEKLV